MDNRPEVNKLKTFLKTNKFKQNDRNWQSEDIKCSVGINDKNLVDKTIVLKLGSLRGVIEIKYNDPQFESKIEQLQKIITLRQELLSLLRAPDSPFKQHIIFRSTFVSAHNYISFKENGNIELHETKEPNMEITLIGELTGSNGVLDKAKSITFHKDNIDQYIKDMEHLKQTIKDLNKDYIPNNDELDDELDDQSNTKNHNKCSNKQDPYSKSSYGMYTEDNNQELIQNSQVKNSSVHRKKLLVTAVCFACAIIGSIVLACFASSLSIGAGIGIGAAIGVTSFLVKKVSHFVLDKMEEKKNIQNTNLSYGSYK